ncbi:hypothetical protein SUDANB58_03178 [Streptomyces sp. enrichment culture]
MKPGVHSRGSTSTTGYARVMDQALADMGYKGN